MIPGAFLQDGSISPSKVLETVDFAWYYQASIQSFVYNVTDQIEYDTAIVSSPNVSMGPHWIYTAPSDGFVDIMASIGFASALWGANGAVAYLSVSKVSVAQYYMNTKCVSFAPSTGVVTLQGFLTVKISAGQQLVVGAIQGGAGTLTDKDTIANSAYTWVTARMRA